MAASNTISFRPRDFKGSRLRCLLLTSQSRTRTAEFFNALTSPDATIEPRDTWAPEGFLKPLEPKLGENVDFLNDRQRQELTAWWLAKPGRANTPNWDLVSTCRYGDRRGLVLVEAKAHEAECADDRCGATNRENFDRIQSALTEANVAWNRLLPGFSLMAESHYQLSNRFAFAWKLAKMGIPVALVYLGFLDGWEMEGAGRRLLRTHHQWKECVTSMSASCVPGDVWDHAFEVEGTPLTVSVRSAKVEVHVELNGTR